MNEESGLLREGVLGHLSLLEKEAGEVVHRQQQTACLQYKLHILRARVHKLRTTRDDLRAKINNSATVQQLTDALSVNGEAFDDPNVKEGSSITHQLQLCLLKARLVQVKDLILAHHLLGGYDIKQSGKSVCFSLATAFEGLYLETYNLEVDLARNVRIGRHNIPPVIPLEKLAKQNLQTDIKAFLSILSRHLNGLSGRRQQVRMIQELLQGSVQVMESNVLYNLLVLVCTEVGDKETPVLCTLEYADVTRWLPTGVTIESEDASLPTSPQWQEVQVLLKHTPAHKVFLTLKKDRRIV